LDWHLLLLHDLRYLRLDLLLLLRCNERW
jgi:hypothetical protein